MTYNGVYYGGVVPMNQYVQAYTVGSNGGIFSLQAPTVVLDGTILGFATNGLRQVLAANPTNTRGKPIGLRLRCGHRRDALHRQHECGGSQRTRDRGLDQF